MVGGGLEKVLIGTTRMDYIHIWKGQRTYLIKIRIREKAVMCKVVPIDRNTTNNKLKFRCLDTKGCCGSCSTGRPRGHWERSLNKRPYRSDSPVYIRPRGTLWVTMINGKDPALMRASFPCTGPRESWRSTAHACLISLLLTADMMWLLCLLLDFPAMMDCVLELWA